MGYEFREPTKDIKNPMLMGKFMRSCAYHQLIQYISRTSASLVNTTMETEFDLSKNAKKIFNILENLDILIDENPPLEIEPGSVRFGIGLQSLRIRVLENRAVKRYRQVFTGNHDWLKPACDCLIYLRRIGVSADSHNITNF